MTIGSPAIVRWIRTEFAGLRSVIAKARFPGSKEYWERRYAGGGNSGPGSYGATAVFKAETLNAFVESHQIRSVVELGCGDGHQLSLARYPNYIGLDVSPTVIDRCSRRFARDDTKSFILYNPHSFADYRSIQSDLAVSLDVILHLVEDDLYSLHMQHLFALARRYVVIFSANIEGACGKTHAPHNRYRKFTDWIECEAPSWRLVERVENPLKGPDSAADFFVYENLERATDLTDRVRHGNGPRETPQSK